MSTWTTEDRQEAEKTMNNELTEGKSAEQPVAWLWTKDGKPQSALLKEPDTVPSDPYWKDKGFKAIPLYTAEQLHPAKHLSLQKVNGELVAVTYTDDEHRIIEVLWEKPPAKTLTDEEIKEIWHENYTRYNDLDVLKFARAILRKAQET